MTGASKMAVVAAIMGISLAIGTACSPEPRTTVVVDTPSETTNTITPLERGEARREAMADVNAGIERWIESDLEGMRQYFSEEQVQRFAEVWQEYHDEGLEVVHVHDVTFLDVFDMNDDGTQVLISYKYRDESYLVDSNGEKVRDLEPVTADIRLTADEISEDEWKIVRIFASSKTLR